MLNKPSTILNRLWSTYPIFITYLLTWEKNYFFSLIFFEETMIWKFPFDSFRLLDIAHFVPRHEIKLQCIEPNVFLNFFHNQSLSNTTVCYAESLPINWALASTFSGRNRAGKVSHGRIFGCGPGFHFTWWILFWLPWWNARDK